MVAGVHYKRLLTNYDSTQGNINSIIILENLIRHMYPLETNTKHNTAIAIIIGVASFCCF